MTIESIKINGSLTDFQSFFLAKLQMLIYNDVMLKKMLLNSSLNNTYQLSGPWLISLSPNIDVSKLPDEWVFFVA